MRDYLKCPHCGQEGITIASKLCLGPAVSAKCTQCGGRFGVSYAATLLLIPFFLLFWVSFMAPFFLLKAVLWVGFLVLMSVAYVRLTPLKPR